MEQAHSTSAPANADALTSAEGTVMFYFDDSAKPVFSLARDKRENALAYLCGVQGALGSLTIDVSGSYGTGYTVRILPPRRSRPTCWK